MSVLCFEPKVKASDRNPQKVIIETDMGNDIDDALALAVALKAMDSGKIELLAVGCHKQSESAAKYVDAVCTYYGHPEVEIGMSLTPVKEFSDYVDYTSLQASAELKTSKTDYPDPVKMYRRILAKADNHSIDFVSIGFGTTLAQLLESEPDEYSSLSGVELVAKKTKILSIMAGSYGEKKRAEYNIINDIPSMQKVFAMWPGIIKQNPFEIGKQVLFPSKLIEDNLGYEGEQPVVDAYKLYKKMPYDRPSWDVLSVIYLIEPELFTESVPGNVSVDDEGFTLFVPNKKGKHYVLSATIDQPQAIQAYMKNIIIK